MINEEYLPHGEMGKGGGGPTEDDDTLSSKQTLKVLFAVSNGPISSVDRVYINGARLSYNETTKVYSIKGIQPDYRLGLPSQNVIPGFSSVESVVPGTTSALTHNNPLLYWFSGNSVDAIRITFYLDKLAYVDKVGNVTKYQVDYTIKIYDIADPDNDTVPVAIEKPSTGLNKVSARYSFDFTINKPDVVTTGNWAVRIYRDTVDDKTDSLSPKDKAMSSGGIMAITQITDKKMTYDGVALIALSFTKANRFNNTVPDLIFKVSGILVKVPYTYNKTTGEYANSPWPLMVGGVPQYWATEQLPSSNPAWQILYLLTHNTYGLGIPENKIDLDAFYEFGKYCDNKIGSTNAIPRYSLSNQFTEREEASKFLSYFFGIANAKASVNKYGLYTVVWDRKRPVTHIVTNSTVVDGIFEYSSNSLEQRYTSINVIYNNSKELGKTTIVTVPESVNTASPLEVDLFNRYGFRTISIPLVGCYSREQAIRKGRWSLYRNSVLVNIVTFKTAFAAFTYEIGEVICVMDDMRCDVIAQGRVLLVTTDVGIPDIIINLDRTIDIAPNSTLYYYSAEGLQKATVTLGNVTETIVSDVITISNSSKLPIVGTPWMLVGEENPTYWEIVSLSFDQESKITTIQCIEYSDSLYDYIDGTISDVIDDTYVGISESTYGIADPENVTVMVMENVTDKSVTITWDWFYNEEARTLYEASLSNHIPLTKDYVNKEYKPTFAIYYSESGGNTEKTVISGIDKQSYIITGLEEGIYDFSVIAISATGLESRPASPATPITIIHTDLHEFTITSNAVPSHGYRFGYETIFKKFEIAYISCNAKCSFSLRTMKQIDLNSLSELDRINLTTLVNDIEVIGGTNYMYSADINFQIEFDNNETSAHKLVPPVQVKQFVPPPAGLTGEGMQQVLALPATAETYWTISNLDTVEHSYVITLLCRKL